MTVDLPVVAGGRCRYGGPRDEVHHIRYESGVSIRVPVLTGADLARLDEARREAWPRLAKLRTGELTAFLQEVGERWLASSTEGRRLVDARAHEFNGLPHGIVQEDCRTIGMFLARRYHTYEAIEAEFGSEHIFDEWVPVQMALRRAFPRGLVLHYLVGNVPLAALYSLVRGIITRNLNLAKWATRDPVTPVGLVQTFLEVDAAHPVSRCLAAAYWPHEAPVGDECLRRADAVCAWGGAEAVESIKRRTPAGTPVSEYGPRWSAAVVDLTEGDLERACFRIVEDVAFYDQEACLSVQRAFVKGDVDAFVRGLGRHFEQFSRRFPMTTAARDAIAHRSMCLLEARYLGWRVESGADWAVVVVEDPADVRVHPLSRTLYVHPVDEIGSVGAHLDRRTQTVSAHPWSVAERHRDDWARLGVDRIVDLGGARVPRPGFTHDGRCGLRDLVRIACHERELLEVPKHGRVSSSAEWERRRFRLDDLPD